MTSCMLMTTVVVDEPSTSSCDNATNVCPDDSTAWVSSCAVGQRCLTFTNASTTETVNLAYQIGCNGNGQPGAPQCDCATGPVLAPGGSTYFVVTNGDYISCLPSWEPPCLTAGLAVMANTTAATCSGGTRVEFTAGNASDPYGRFDSYDIDVQPTVGGGLFYSVPVSFGPTLTCYQDTTSGDCRTVWCDSATCPDAYNTSTSGGCVSMSPQVGCQDTFSQSVGLTVTYFPASGQSCNPATPCSTVEQ